TGRSIVGQAPMRVIVAGRPNPPIPDDVPDWHPLRDSGIIRLLPDSPHARDFQRRGRQELQRLLHGSAAEQDVLGLLTAARGGLSGADLEQLTGVPLWDIEEILDTVAGRTCTRRASTWTPQTGPKVYLLGHEELQATAVRYLAHRIGGYHDRLHNWAGSFRSRGWPPGTPEYLLSGYFRLLVTLGDLPGMIACAGDPARHDRMLHLTGGDAAALVEVRTALDLAAAQDTPDLVSALRLAHHRDQLTDRNVNIPVDLPSVWAIIGQVSRAEALANSTTKPQALARVAGALAEAGQHQQAETLARSLTDPDWQPQALARVAEALAEAGDNRSACRLAAATCVAGHWTTAAIPVLILDLCAHGADTHAPGWEKYATVPVITVTDTPVHGLHFLRSRDYTCHVALLQGGRPLARRRHTNGRLRNTIRRLAARKVRSVAKLAY
ncbi:MAG: hypothetical protein ABJB47_11800, partial [Actinomycetota bacterium]